MRLVIALGGNALARRGKPLTAAGQRAQVRVFQGLLEGVLVDGHIDDGALPADGEEGVDLGGHRVRGVRQQ